MKTMKTEAGTELPLLNLRGKDYLQVAHRIVWFRECYPEGTIETTIFESSEDHSIVRAKIMNADKVLAMGTKREDKKHFADHLEKAETGAIGRALALCGFGTQFAPEFDEGERLADSPLPAKNDGVYRFTFGKYKGKTISEVGIEDAFDYASYIHKQIQETKEEIKPWQQDMFDAVKKARAAANGN